MSEQKKEFLFKILLCGDGAVGKTSIREQYMGKGFSGSYMKTIGADFASKRMEKGNNKITLQIFDLAGQDAYVTARKSFYKGGQAAFLVFDLQDPSSLHNLKKWIDDSIENSGGSIGTFVILGNKADLVETRQVSNEMATEYAQQLSAQTGLTFVFLETSAKTGMNIDLAFDIMANRLLKKHNIDTEFELPDEVELISPSDSKSTPPITTQAPTGVQTEGLQNQIDELNSKIDGISEINTKMSDMDERLSQLEDKFSKLAQIVRNLVQNNK